MVKEYRWFDTQFYFFAKYNLFINLEEIWTQRDTPTSAIYIA